MSILFSGSQGTGKSTIVERLKDLPALKGWDIADSISEKFFTKEDFKNASSEHMIDLQRRFSEFQLKIFGSQNTLSSRGYADIWAYTKHLNKLNPNPDYLRQMDMIAEAAMASTAKIIYFPIKFEISGKELRSTNKAFQEEIDQNILQFFEAYDIPYHAVESISIIGRVAEIASVCNLEGA